MLSMIVRIAFVTSISMTLLGCSTESLREYDDLVQEMGGMQPGYNTFPEAFSFPKSVDGNNWKLGYQFAKNGIALYEFVPKGETVENWSELITSHYISYVIYPKTTPIEKIAEINLNGVKNHCSHFTSNYIEKTEESVIYQWEIKDCGKGIDADQVEIARIVKGNYGFNSIHYAVKTSNLSSAKRNQMLKAVESSQINSRIQ